MFNDRPPCDTQANHSASASHPPFDPRSNRIHSGKANAGLANAHYLDLQGSCSHPLERRRPESENAKTHRGRQAPLSTSSIKAIHALRRMHGGSQSQLMLGDDGRLWVVKFKNNPQHLKTLANELMATRIAESIGLSVPKSAIIHVTQELIESNPHLFIDHGRGWREICSSGLQFGSSWSGTLMPGQVIDILPEEQLQRLRNLEEFAGMLAFDKWTSNADRRQAVFQRTARAKQYSAVFVDQGFCFNAGEWSFQDMPQRGVFERKSVYSVVTDWDSFEPWLTRIEQFSPDVLWKIARTVPPEWYWEDLYLLEELVETLLVRRSGVRKLISELRQSSHTPFPNWKNGQFASMSRCQLKVASGGQVDVTTRPSCWQLQWG